MSGPSALYDRFESRFFKRRTRRIGRFRIRIWPDLHVIKLIRARRNHDGRKFLLLKLLRHRQRIAFLRQRGRQRARALGRTVTFLPDAAESLSLGPASVDTVLATLVLCTVDDMARALAQIQRVLKPGGHLLFLEHVRLEHPLWGRVQDAVTPVWKTLLAGCHPNRDTVSAIRRAGFAIGELERYAFGPIPGPLFVRGAALAARS